RRSHRRPNERTTQNDIANACASEGAQPEPLTAVSMFTNCGAGDFGFAQAGFRLEVLPELEERRLQIAKLNHPPATGIPGDVRETWPAIVAAHRAIRGGRRPALLAACPPCQ